MEVESEGKDSWNWGGGTWGWSGNLVQWKLLGIYDGDPPEDS